MTKTSRDAALPALEPIRKSVTVDRTPTEAFDVFTRGIAEWWPLRTHSISQDRAATCVIEPKTGGAVYEVRDDGERFPWGRVLAWDPPLGLVLSWHPGREPEVAQEVEVRFTAVGNGTRVDLEHRRWERLGDEAADVRRRYEDGWGDVLERRYRDGAAREKGTKEVS
jgi:uncharacterized protein YndB with AHSA1/START domain